MSQDSPTPKSTLAALRSQVYDFSQHLLTGKLIDARIYHFPVASIDKDGNDGVFNGYEHIPLRCIEGWEAVHDYCGALAPQSKKDGLSSLSARRLGGVIHITGLNDWLTKTYSMLDTIHQLKSQFRQLHVASAPTRYARQKLLAKFAPDLLPLTAYRQFPYYRADVYVEKVYFSWITEGQNFETLSRTEVESRIDKINRRKVENGSRYSLDSLMSIDEAKLPSGTDTFTLVRPSKVRACMQAQLAGQSSPSVPQHVSLPLLVLQPSPLGSEPYLDDFNLHEHKVKRYGRRRNLVPVIEEYGLFIRSDAV